MGLIASGFIGFSTALLFAYVLYWLDRYEKEPLLLLGGVFLWGAVIAAGSAFIINTSRGEVLVEEDLFQALKQGQLAGAALDVREKEPPSTASPLHGLDSVILAPHVAGLTYEAQEKVIDAVSEDVDRVLSGQPALRFVNFGLPKK